VLLIPLDQLVPTPDNPRRIRINEPAFQELVKSIKSVGILQHLIARPMPADRMPSPATKPNNYWDATNLDALHAGKQMFDLRAGHRRLLAADHAGLSTVPVVVRDMDDRTAMEITVSENMQRENLTPLEESEGVQHLLDVGWEIQSIADRLGKPASWVARRAKLRELSTLWRAAIEERDDLARWPATVLELVARLPSDTQDTLFDDLVDDKWRPGDKRVAWMSDVEVPTVREMEQNIDHLLHSLHGAPWKLDDESLVPEAGSCSVCTKRSTAQPLLWGDAEGNGKKRTDRCLDRNCYAKKLAVCIARKTEELKAAGHAPIGLIDAHSSHEEIEPVRGELKPVNKFDVNEAKKNDAHAVPAVVLDGAHAGTVRWVKPCRAGASKTVTRAQREKGKPTPLAERRKVYARRRQAHVISAIRDELKRMIDKKAPLPDAKSLGINDVDALVLAFGTQHRQNFFIDAKPWKRFEQVRKCSEDYKDDMLRSVLPVLRSRLLIHNGEHAERIYPEAKRVADFLRLDWTKLKVAASQAIPDPKGWANLNTNGTPKKPAAKRTRKPAGPETSSDSAPESPTPERKRARTKARKATVR